MIGHSFCHELQQKELATGLSLLLPGVSWCTNDPDRDMDPLPESLSAEQRHAIEEVLAAHNPTSAVNLLIDVHQNRVKEYPPIGDQLDALWHAMNLGVLPKVEPFYTNIADVKAKYPKPISKWGVDS